MDPGNTDPAAAAAGAGASSDGGAAGTTQATTPDPNAGIKDLISSFRTELVDFRREIRNQLKPAGGRPAAEQGASGAATTTTPAPAAWDPSAVLAFRDAVEESGVTVNVAQRKLLEKLFRNESGVADPVAWVREQADTLGWKKPAPTQAAPVVQAPAAQATQVVAPAKAPTNPAPAGTGAGVATLPDDPALLTQAAIDAMTPEEAKAHWEKYKRRTGQFRHPFADARDRERVSGQELNNAAAALRQVLSGKK